MPTVVVGTDEFQALGVLESKARGMPDLRFAITKHPIGGLRPPVVLEKAAAMVDQTAQAITGVSAARGAEASVASRGGGD